MSISELMEIFINDKELMNEFIILLDYAKRKKVSTRSPWSD